MADYMLYVSTHGADDPVRAGLAIRAAIAATNEKVEARVALLGNGIFLMKDEVASKIQVQVGERPQPNRLVVNQRVQTMTALLQMAKEAGVSFYV
jgi:predicted peroxiredoxin